ncbi:asparagine synthase (glutamine-hydrolyzing) [Maioricimonas sp. JC845]|uniref:asparagine synthase (glutamine-hydrolyzing) n=1 Tax=Maioricimonas sp. JC845 TaxID=3232138 RepID=UPI003457D647
MCGFFQVVEKHGPVSTERFEAALASMASRGPDGTGTRFVELPHPAGNQSLHAAYGHQRLSILDLTARGQQPFHRQGHTLLYNGELYNYRDLASRLRPNGYEPTSDGDTDVLFSSLLTHGAEALKLFSGMWAFSFVDEAGLQLTAARDRFGKKPLFYYMDGSTLCLSSTIHAIAIYLQQSLKPRRSDLLAYFLDGTLYPSGTADTHFEGIQQVLPGHVCRFDLKNWHASTQPYFDWSDVGASAHVVDPDVPLKDSLRDCVRDRLVSDRPVGLLLSGGIDSSLVYSVLCATGAIDQVHVFMGDVGRSADFDYAKRCVETVGGKAETVHLDYDQQAFDLFLEICRHQEKPFLFNGNALAMPQMYRAISDHGIPVVLDGTGGDELFGGYWGRQLPHAIRDAIARSDHDWLQGVVSANRDMKFVADAMKWARAAGDGAATKTSWTTAVTRRLHPLLRCTWREARDLLDRDPLNHPRQGFTEALCSDIAPGGRLGEWLWHNDRNAMMWSIENRSPLLDHRLHRFLFSGYRNKFAGEWNKHELRQVFSEFTPLPTQWRRDKQGFRWNAGRFLRTHCQQILELIEASDWCGEVFNNRLFVQCAHRVPKMLASSLGRHALCVAGLEATLAGSVPSTTGKGMSRTTLPESTRPTDDVRRAA